MPTWNIVNLNQHENYNNSYRLEIMDCYIVRVYRRMASKEGQGSEIAGLVERVGDAGTRNAFSSYQDLVNRLRGAPLSEEPEQSGDAARPASVEAVVGSDTVNS